MPIVAVTTGIAAWVAMLDTAEANEREKWSRTIPLVMEIAPLLDRDPKGRIMRPRDDQWAPNSPMRKTIQGWLYRNWDRTMPPEIETITKTLRDAGIDPQQIPEEYTVSPGEINAMNSLKEFRRWLGSGTSVNSDDEDRAVGAFRSKELLRADIAAAKSLADQYGTELKTVLLPYGTEIPQSISDYISKHPRLHAQVMAALADSILNKTAFSVDAIVRKDIFQSLLNR